MRLSNGKNVITVTMDFLRELDADGQTIGNGGPNSVKHSRDTFANTDFEFEPIRSSHEFGVASYAIDFATTLVADSKLLISTHIFKATGTIFPTDGESWDVGGGSIKFSVSVSSWPFCTGETGHGTDQGWACQGATGEFLEFGMEIKGQESGATNSSAKTFSLATNPETGEDITLELSDEIYVDDEWLQMPEGYPKVITSDSKQLFIFRFPRFNGSALYDPVINGLAVEEKTSDEGGLFDSLCA